MYINQINDSVFQSAYEPWTCLSIRHSLLIPPSTGLSPPPCHWPDPLLYNQQAESPSVSSFPTLSKTVTQHLAIPLIYSYELEKCF